LPKQIIIKLIDSFYPPFKKLMPLQTFRYAACGGGNTVLGIAIFYIFHEYVFKGKIFDFGFYAMKAHTASNLVSFTITLLVGFLLMKYLVFTGSNLKGRIQLFRYTLSSLTNLVISTLLLKLFVEVLHINAIIAQLITTVIVIAIAYLSQKHFTFKIKDA
jgi:putative flippase GtrA